MKTFLGDIAETLHELRKPGYPARSPVLRRSLARRDICPECGGELDTGWECNACGYDASLEAYPADARARDERQP